MSNAVIDNMICWENKELIGIDRFTVLDSNRRKVYFFTDGRGRVNIDAWDEKTINQNVMDETASRIEYGQLPEKVRVAVQFKRNS